MSSHKEISDFTQEDWDRFIEKATSESYKKPPIILSVEEYKRMIAAKERGDRHFVSTCGVINLCEVE